MKKLLVIENDDLKFVIKGKPKHPNFSSSERRTKIKDVIKTKTYIKNFNIKYYSTKKGRLINYNNEKIYPLFYEQQDLNIIIRDKKEGKLDLSFDHIDENIQNSVEKIDDDLLTGIINFNNHIGKSIFTIRSHNNIILRLEIKVFPTKIDYENDYKAMVKEINNEVYNLAYDFLKRTFQSMTPNDKKSINHSEFFSILDGVFENFIKAFRRIENNTHSKFKKVSNIKRIEKVKRVNKKSIKWINKNPRHYNKDSKLPKKILTFEKKNTYNIFENKFIKWIIKELIKRLKKFEKDYKKTQSKNHINKKVLEKINIIENKLNSIIHLSFLKDVGDIYKIDSISLVIQMAPGYREIYKYYLMLKKGLKIESDIFKLSLKDTAELYEYWCFLKINQILREEYELVSEDLVKLNYEGLNVKLDKGKKSIIRYFNPKTKEYFKLAYNKFEGKRNLTTNNKPDYILSLEKNNSKSKYKFIFDAKYRVDELNNPTNESINAMHRYRDAIVSKQEDQYKRNMVGAYVLFPRNEENEYKESKFYKSIKEVNIGGYPFLPGSIKLMGNFLKNIVEESSLASYERNILPLGHNEYLENTKFEKNVLIGTIKSKEQLEFIKNKKIYHMPYKKSDDFLKNQIKYLTIYKSNKKFGKESGIYFYAKINKWKIKNRKKIPFRKKKYRKNFLYHYFEISELIPLKSKIEVKDFFGNEPNNINIRFVLTSELLLKRAKYFPELTLDNFLEWRIWIELNRLRSHFNKNRYKDFHLKNIKFIIKNGYLRFLDQKLEIRKVINNIYKYSKYIAKIISKK
ncbi:MAG: DUF2357 domain-containing protein [Bacillota bacterium]